MNRILVIVGFVLIVSGIFWKQLTRLPLGRLPGDFQIHHQHWHMYFPIGTSIVLSVVLSLLFWLLRRFF